MTNIKHPDYLIKPKRFTNYRTGDNQRYHGQKLELFLFFYLNLDLDLTHYTIADRGPEVQWAHRAIQ